MVDRRFLESLGIVPGRFKALPQPQDWRDRNRQAVSVDPRQPPPRPPGAADKLFNHRQELERAILARLRSLEGRRVFQDVPPDPTTPPGETPRVPGLDWLAPGEKPRLVLRILATMVEDGVVVLWRGVRAWSAAGPWDPKEWRVSPWKHKEQAARFSPPAPVHADLICSPCAAGVSRKAHRRLHCGTCGRTCCVHRAYRKRHPLKVYAPGLRGAFKPMCCRCARVRGVVPRSMTVPPGVPRGYRFVSVDDRKAGKARRMERLRQWRERKDLGSPVGPPPTT